MPSKIITPQLPVLNHQMDLFVQLNGLSLRIPHRYLEGRLKSFGPGHFNCSSSASCKISFVDLTQGNGKRNGAEGKKISKDSTNSSPVTSRKRSYSSLSTVSLGAYEFWGHELFLSTRSQWFRDFFANHYDEHGVDDPRGEYVSDENGRWLRVLVNVHEPSRSRIDELLYWIYTGNDERWLRNAFTPKNYALIAENVRILGLDAEAMAVCTRYKALLVCPRCLITRTEGGSETDNGRCESGNEGKSYDTDNKRGRIIQSICENVSERSGDHMSDIDDEEESHIN
ncbi:9899_t:CDS:2 [Paraglomus brasilianum]|uniref:9899_t:CDS:1 n=1 Tax=Paraglomus brasilianum TaxID=144538 RepID=A0A9N9FSU2_9GLOM|nr:9899_t:CDS:2 [Paraglomus brasilianum]